MPLGGVLEEPEEDSHQGCDEHQHCSQESADETHGHDLPPGSVALRLGQTKVPKGYDDPKCLLFLRIAVFAEASQAAAEGLIHCGRVQVLIVPSLQSQLAQRLLIALSLEVLTGFDL